jgi:hypothetical protein
MLAPYMQLQADTIEHTAVFAVELIDPVTLQVASRGGITVTASFQQAGLWNKAVNRGSRFVWLVNSDPSTPTAGAVPNSLTVTPPPGSGYAPFTYSAADIAAGTSTTAGEWGLCRLYLRTTPSYGFPSGITQLRGLLRQVPDVPGQPIQPLAGAQVWLQWMDASTNPATARAGSRCMSGTRGDFAASLVFPTKASKSYPATEANGALTLTLYVARLDPVAGWQQAHLVPAQPNPLGNVLPGQVASLPAPIAWSNLTAG